MTFAETMAAFAEGYGIAGLDPSEGKVALQIDGIDVALSDLGDSRIAATAAIGTPPPERPEVFADMLLEANKDEDASIFSKSPETKEYLLTANIKADSVDAFSTAFAAFVNKVEIWRKLNADFRPAAQDAVSATAEEIPSTGYGMDGFMQV